MAGAQRRPGGSRRQARGVGGKERHATRRPPGAVGVQGAPLARRTPERSAWRRNVAPRAECSRQAVRAGGKRWRSRRRAQRPRARSSPALPLAGVRSDGEPGADKRPGLSGASPRFRGEGGHAAPLRPAAALRTTGAPLTHARGSRPQSQSGPRSRAGEGGPRPARRAGRARDRTGCGRLRGRPLSRAQRGPRRSR